jgi:hypothetical protein
MMGGSETWWTQFISQILLNYHLKNGKDLCNYNFIKNDINFNSPL